MDATGANVCDLAHLNKMVPPGGKKRGDGGGNTSHYLTKLILNASPKNRQHGRWFGKLVSLPDRAKRTRQSGGVAACRVPGLADPPEGYATEAFFEEMLDFQASEQSPMLPGGDREAAFVQRRRGGEGDPAVRVLADVY